MKSCIMKVGRSLGSVICILAILAVLVACGSSQNNSVQNTNKAAQSKSTVNTGVTQPQAKPVTLKVLYWSNPATVDAVKALDAKFQAKYPNVTVEATDVPPAQWAQTEQTRISAGDVDVCAIEAFSLPLEDWNADSATKPAWQDYADQGLFEDLTNQPFVKNFYESAIKDCSTYNGKVYSVPTGTVAFNGIFYSKDMFDKYNLKVPKTWDEFINVCKTLKSNGVIPMTIGGKDVWPYNMMMEGIIAAYTPDMQTLAKQYYTGERKFNDDQSMVLWNKMAEFTSYVEPGFAGIDYASVTGRFVAGKAAMLPDGTWDAATIAKADPNFKFGYFPIPGDNAEETTLAGKYDGGWVVLSHAANKDTALQWLDFYSQNDNYSDFINTVGFTPCQDVEIKDDFNKSLLPEMKNFKLNWEMVFYTKKGQGKYAGFTPLYLKVAGGPIADVKTLADLSEKDWEAAGK